MENMSKELIAFFSRAGENYFGGSYRYVNVRNTGIVAGMIHELTGAEMFRIDPVNPYSEDYETCTAEAKEGQRPRCPPRDPRVSGRPRRVRYGISRVSELLGHMPMPVFTFLERFDFSGKTIRPFCTHEGSGMGCSVSDIKRICPDAIVEQGLALVESSVRESEGVVARWLGHRVFPQLYPCIPPSER